MAAHFSIGILAHFSISIYSQAADITSKRNIVPSYKAFLAVRIDFIKAMSELTSPCIKYLFFRWQVAS